MLNTSGKYNEASYEEVYPLLLCIHIPKTAGRTFRQALKEQYGEDRILTLDFQYLKKRKETLADYPVNQYPVVHGHLHYEQLLPYKMADTQWITWLRHPVDRVLSNYYFYCTNGYVTRKRQDPDLQLMSLEEYIHRPRKRNVMTRFMGELKPSECLFIGLQEHYPDDLRTLAQKLGWQLPEDHYRMRINVNTAKPNLRTSTPESLKNEIARLNTKDMALYEEAVMLRSKGYWQ
ncbi:MAG: sulfotransferase family 2 domain-containing protein [Phaeodactylibacter sp.]|uniref:sulfotransferase family 2 domain-containing protein n=1 Tax=Phaeodactylibacter sp. TaxID=1940289 RepID=UPI0032EAA3B3